MENQTTLQMVLEQLSNWTKKFTNYFYYILSWILLFWLYMWWAFSSLFSMFWSWNIKLIWWGIITIMLMLIFWYIWYWIFSLKQKWENWADKIWMKDIIVDFEIWENKDEDEFTKIIQLAIFLSLLTFYLFIWYFVWFNIWKVSIVSHQIIINILQATWGIWSILSIIWNNLLNIIIIFGVFLLVKFLINLHFILAEKLKSKIKSWEGIDIMALMFLVLATIVIFFLSLYSFWLANNWWNISWKVQNIINQTWILNQIK